MVKDIPVHHRQMLLLGRDEPEPLVTEWTRVLLVGVVAVVPFVAPLAGHQAVLVLRFVDATVHVAGLRRGRRLTALEWKHVLCILVYVWHYEHGKRQDV